jgi:hypothetical protein
MQGEQQHHSCKTLWGRTNQSSSATEQLADHYIRHETLRRIETRVEAKAVADKQKKNSNNLATEDQRLADLIIAGKSESRRRRRRGDLEAEPIGAIDIKRQYGMSHETRNSIRLQTWLKFHSHDPATQVSG